MINLDLLPDSPIWNRIRKTAADPKSVACPICKGTGTLAMAGTGQRELFAPKPEPPHCWCCMGTGKVRRDWTKGAK